VDRAEDLVQSTLLKACDRRNRFEQGTCLQAWLFTILKNDFYTEHRKRQREVEDVEGSYAVRLIALPDQLSGLELQDLSKALSQLPLLQREVLLLVGAEGMSYEEIATHQHVSVGTIKSRVNRARHHLADILGLGPKDAIGIRFTHHWRLRACSHERMSSGFACHSILSGHAGQPHSDHGPNQEPDRGRQGTFRDERRWGRGRLREVPV
jgi:RNA polymerase sigma-70 factor, ECF subfamily